MLTTLGGIWLVAFAASDHRLPILPADASAAGVLPAAALIGLLVGVLREFSRRRTFS